MMSAKRWGIVVLATSAVGVAVACGSSSDGAGDDTSIDAGNDADNDAGTISPDDDAGADAGIVIEGLVAYEQRFDVDGAVLGADGVAAFGNLRYVLSDCRHNFQNVTIAPAVTSGCSIETCSDPFDGGGWGPSQAAGAITITGPHVADGGFTMAPLDSGTYFGGTFLPGTSIVWLPGDTGLSVHAEGAAFPAFDVSGFVGPSPLTSLTVNATDGLIGNPTFSRKTDMTLTYAGVTAGTSLEVDFGSGSIGSGSEVNLRCVFDATSASEVIRAADLQKLGTSGSFSYDVSSTGTVTPKEVSVKVTLDVGGSPQQTFTTTD